MQIYGNKLSIHLGDDKTKSILFTSKRKMKKVPKWDIYNNIQIKRHSQVTRLGCMLDETMPGESVAHKVISRVYARLWVFTWRK